MIAALAPTGRATSHPCLSAQDMVEFVGEEGLDFYLGVCGILNVERKCLLAHGKPRRIKRERLRKQ